MMNQGEKEEALQELVSHYGMPVFLELVDGILNRIQGGVLSVPLDKDPEKASLALYAERMKAEGAVAVKQALVSKIESIKTGMREGRNK